ncbi:von Willebrand factor A [Frankia sp. R43]|uniref:vWA domain-containing protein n=1 Tax=Frankia sp. R43 TaxID=269536 RepID=UPI0006CA5BF1|nr:VWA domain-containing protein [Frankia sp. R43]KPM54725.1 von Willebrand factor A [Frankia sp. R43]
MSIRARLGALVLALTAAATLPACSGGEPPLADGAGPKTTLTVLAGSELKDIEPLLADLRHDTGVKLDVTYTGTLDGADRIARRQAGTDLAWFSSDRYLRLLPGGADAAVTSTSIMRSPVVLGVRQSVARKLGWSGNPNVTWKDVAAAARAGNLRYGMTNPASSNSGFSALVGVAAALAGTADALTSADIRPAELTDFFSGQKLTAGSSGYLNDAYVDRQDSLDAMINYESVLLSLNASNRLREPLELIFPKDGIITADYPLLLLDPARREAYQRVVDWLRSPATQQRLQEQTSRRPATPTVPLDTRFTAGDTHVELPFPGTAAVADELILAYLNHFRAPTHAIFVLDLSGSMEGDRISDLRSALIGLTGADSSLAARFTSFRAREKITLVPFDSGVNQIRDFAVTDPSPDSPELKKLRRAVDGFNAGGDTAIYSALRAAYDRAAADLARDGSYYTSVVLLTDGENTAGASADDFLEHYRSLSPAARAVPTFTVLFGDADPDALRQIADVTGGTVFDAGSTSLPDVFKEIRGYQ